MTQPSPDECLLAVYRLASRRKDFDPSQVPVSHQDLEAELDIPDSLMCAANGRLETDGLARSSDASITLTPVGRDRAEVLFRELNTPVAHRAWRVINLPFPSQIIACLIGAVLGSVLTFVLQQPDAFEPPARP